MTRWLPTMTSRRRRRPTTWPALLILCALWGGGCARGVYRATNLPAEFLVAQRENVEAVDLSRLTNMAVSSERVERGDVLEVTMVTDFRDLTTNTTPVRVGEDGKVNIPLIGPVAVAGLELEEAERVVGEAGIERGVFRKSHVTLTMKRQRKNRVTVTGAVEEPGVYEVPRSDSTLLAALVAAGGLTKDAGAEVEIRGPVARGGTPGLKQPASPRIAAAGQETELASYEAASAGPPGGVRINLVSAAQEGRGNLYVEDGSVVSVAKRSLRPIQVLGLVSKPGQFEMPLNQDLYLMDALAMAGGLTTAVADKVLVIRTVPGCPEPIKIQVSVREAKQNGQANLRLAPGDVVSVEDTAVTFFWDTMKTFVRVGLSGGITLF